MTANKRNMERKDWTGNRVTAFKTIGARNQCRHERQSEDYYATEPKAAINTKNRFEMIDIEKLSETEKLVKEEKLLRKKIEKAFLKRQMGKEKIACIFGAMTALNIGKDAKLFVMLYICSPHTLSGCKMKRGLRDFLASLFKYTSVTSVSMISKNLLFRYKHYKTLQNEVDTALNAITRSFGCSILPDSQRITEEK